nr:MAG TPA: hypothetical protein [Caudoviricetes sp.]
MPCGSVKTICHDFRVQRMTSHDIPSFEVPRLTTAENMI